MARSLWTGSISFGLVNVPVRLYTAVAHKEIHFHLLHEPDGGRIQFRRFCSVEEKEVPYEEIIRGYELSKGRYVPLEQEELDKLDFKTTHSIDIEEFVDLHAIDPMYFDTPYYVGPDERGTRGYALLTEAMTRTGKVAIARMVMRSRQYLCALRPLDGRLVLSTMQYADELVSPATIDIPKAEAPSKGREIEMAEQLIQSLSAEFNPRKYKDTYRERVLELVEKKAAGEELVGAEPPAARGIVNLAEALAASLAHARSAGGGGEPARATSSRRASPRRAGRTRASAKTRRAHS
jgi:DNA end-binding protein Ku